MILSVIQLNQFNSKLLQFVKFLLLLDSMNIYTNFTDKPHVNMKPLYDLLHDKIKFYWNKEPETLFQQIKTSLTKDVNLTLPKTNHPFLIFVDSSMVGSAWVLYQMNDKR